MKTLLIDLLPYLISLAITLGLAVFTFRRRSVLGARSFFALILIEILETVGFILELSAPTLNGKMFWDNFQWFTTLLLGVAMLDFSLEYIGKNKPVVRRWIGLLVIGALGFATMISVDLFPGWGILSPRLIVAEPFSVYTYEFGPLTYIAFIYSYILIFSGFFIIGREAIREKGIFRLQSFIILIGLFIPLLGTILVLLGVELMPNRDIFPLTFPVGNTLIIFGLFRYRIFDIVPIARTALMDYIADPVVVLDNRDIILDTNPAFEEMLKLPKRKLVMKPIRHFLASLQPLDEAAQNHAIQDEIVLPIGDEKRFLDTNSKPFNNRLGDYGGRLLILHDITYHMQLEEEERQRGEELEQMIQKRSAELVTVNKKLQEKVTKQSLLEKEQQTEAANLEAIFESSPVAMLILDETTNIIMANRAAIILTGGTEQEVLQHRPGNALRCFHSHTDPRGCGYSKDCKICVARNGIESLLANGGSMQRAELPLVLIRNGKPQTVFLEMGAENILINGQRHLCVAMNDVTESKWAKEELSASQARYKSLIETQSDLIARSDLDGRLTFVNDAYCKAFGKTRERLLGRSFSPTVFPEDQPTVTAMIKAIRLPPHHMQTETRHPTPSGIRWFSWNNAAVLDESGKVQELQGIGRDITDRKQAEDALRNSEIFNQALIAASPIGISVRSRTGDLLSSNAAWRNIWAIPDEEYQEMLEQRSNELIFDEKDVILLPHQEQVRQVYEQGGSLNLPDLKTMYYRPGNAEWVSQYYYAILDDQGQVERVVTLTEDISLRKKAEAEIRLLNDELEQRVAQRTDQLEFANKELESFSYSVSHDLRAPLRGIDGWSLALLEDYGSQLDGQAKTYLERVRSETQRMGQLIDDLLQLSRLTTSEMMFGKVDLSAMTATIAAHLQEEQPERQVEFVIQPGLCANGDARLLEIALTNLLGNAFKFTAKTPQARIQFGQTEVESQRAFYVRDNGAGFDMARAKKLFGAFQRMHKASDYPGTGVGLTTVQRIVHRHDGRIWAQAAVDQGATFYFTLEEIP